MNTALKITVFTVLSILFYMYVGQLVPQKIVEAPKELTLSADTTTDEMCTLGQKLVETKGQCLTCHTMGHPTGRFPDLVGVGERAQHRKPGFTDIEYLAETLYDPSAYIVPGFNPGMPAVNKPPIGLNDDEIKCVIAYLQSLGGESAITMKTKLKYSTPVTGTAEASTESSAPAGAVADNSMSGKDLIAKYGCMTCHSFSDAAKLVGPSLYDVGKRLSRAQIYESVVEPDASIAAGFSPGVMSATLAGNGFTDKATPTQLKSIVNYLSSLKGN